MAHQVNGEVPTSVFLDVSRNIQALPLDWTGRLLTRHMQHLLKYPVINDSVKTFKENSYGQKSIQLGDSAYKTFAQPVLPYFSKPYQYVSPYVKKADSFGDTTLSKVDARFPIVKKPTGELYADAKSVVFFPYRKGMESKDHFVTTYSDEYKKVGGDGIVTYGKALISTTIIITSETVSWVGEFLTAKKAEAKDAVEKVNN